MNIGKLYQKKNHKFNSTFKMKMRKKGKKTDDFFELIFENHTKTHLTFSRIR